jgi:peroxiredoxin
VLILGAAFAAVLLLVQAPARHAYLKWSVLHTAAPTDEAVWDSLDGSPQPITISQQIWRQGKLVPRIKLLQYLRRHAIDASTLWPGIRPLVLEAVRSGDIDVEQSALGLLEDHNDPAAPLAALQMIHDPDPEVRRSAIFFMSRSGDRRFLRNLMPLLQDPDHSIQGCAQGALSMLAGEDFGDAFDIDNGLSPSNVARWNQWWVQHRAEYAPLPESDSPPVSAAAWAALPEFSLPDLDGDSVRLADFRGKPVVLSFWAKDESNSVRQVPQWIEFQHRHPEIVLLAVSLDALAEHHDHSHGLPEDRATAHEMHDHETMHEHTAAKAEEGEDGKPDEDVAVQIRRFATRNNINYRILIDRTGSTAEAFGGEDIPVCLWIDAEGQLRRRTRVTTGGSATLEAVAKSSF